MDFDDLAFLFALAAAIHNLEEALLVPGWIRRTGFRIEGYGKPEFRFAVMAFTLGGFVLAALAAAGFVAPTYLLCGLAVAIAINAIVPHLAMTLFMRVYVPGTATGLLLALPAATLLVRAGFEEERIAWSTFWWAAPATALGVVAAIPALLALGRRVAR